MGIKGKNKPKIIVILGPTASGKSDLAVKIATLLNTKKSRKDFLINGAEIISADSRQVYRGMDLGTGKITIKETKSIPHHLLDVASPKRKFTVSQYQKLAEKSINKILKNNKIPILCGGSAFYLKTITDGILIPEVSPDWKLRNKLEKLETDSLYELIKKRDPSRAKKIDKKNRRRLIRAIEIFEKTKKPVPKIKINPLFDCLFLGIKVEQKELNKKIDKRLYERLENGMIEEVQKLKNSGLSWKRLEGFGLEYKWISLYLQEKIDYEKMKESLSVDIKRFSRKQMTWWKNDKRINWITEKKDAESLIKNFLHQ